MAKAETSEGRVEVPAATVARTAAARTEEATGAVGWAVEMAAAAMEGVAAALERRSRNGTDR